MADDYADTILNLIERRSQTGTPEQKAVLRSVLREVAPDRLLPPQPSIGTVLQYDAESGPVLLQRGVDGYRRISDTPTTPNPALDWRYVSKLPGLTRLVPDMAPSAPTLPWAPAAAPSFLLQRDPARPELLRIGPVVFDANDIRSVAAICHSVLLHPDGDEQVTP
jgi:hypothetical protein